MLDKAMKMKGELVEHRRWLHTHAETGFDLQETANYVCRQLEDMGYLPRRIGRCGIVADLNQNAEPTILLRADMDALPIQEETGLNFASQNGRMHACGHDLHTAMLLGAAHLLVNERLPGNVRFLFQPAEELLEGAVDMIKEDVWGNRTMLLRTYCSDIFGETFACGEDALSVVTFVAAENCKVMFLSFCRVMHTCTNACAFHQTLIENMVRIIARKNRELMRKIEVVSKKTLREKILSYLSIQSQAQGSRSFEIPLGRMEWAEYLCADRSALTRELVKMKAEGLIDYQRNFFEIL